MICILSILKHTLKEQANEWANEKKMIPIFLFFFLIFAFVLHSLLLFGRHFVSLHSFLWCVNIRINWMDIQQEYTIYIHIQCIVSGKLTNKLSKLWFVFVILACRHCMPLTCSTTSLSLSHTLSFSLAHFLIFSLIVNSTEIFVTLW